MKVDKFPQMELIQQRGKFVQQLLGFTPVTGVADLAGFVENRPGIRWPLRRCACEQGTPQPWQGDDEQAAGQQIGTQARLAAAQTTVTLLDEDAFQCRTDHVY
ncbi:MAG: hypothetical protein LAT56_08525 [Wenzhouxiangella sp.]|nr:hypothetical protein [Wenzhouxiangella sp.]